MCELIDQEGCDKATRLFFHEEAKLAALGQSKMALVSAAAPLEPFSASLHDKTDGFGDGLHRNDNASHHATIGTQEFSFSIHSGVESGYIHRTESYCIPSAAKCFGLLQSKQEHHGAAYMTTRTLPLSQTLHVPGTVSTAADISPTLLAALLSCTYEMIEVGQTQPQTLQEEQINQPFPCQVMEYVRIRLFSSTFFPLPFRAKKACVALSWFLQRHHKLSATMMSMGFSFLIGLERYHFSWKKALEVPLTGLQLLASYVYAVSSQHVVNAFDNQSPREHLLLMAACLLASWKFAEIDASATALVSILNRTFFRRQRVLCVKDVIQVEFVVLEACGLRVEVPCWWRVAIELFTELLIEEEETQGALGNGETELQVWWSHASSEKSETQQGNEAKLEQLLLASERFLLFVMDVVTEGDGSAVEEDGCRTETSRLYELRGALRCWMEFHPLFGVALAVASGAMELEWAASRIAPTGRAHINRDRELPQTCCVPPADIHHNATRDADEAAQQEVRAMVAVLTEALHHMSQVKSGDTSLRHR